jgi:hypothetical protein
LCFSLLLLDVIVYSRGGIFYLFFAIIWLIALYNIFRTINFLDRSLETKGVVIELVEIYIGVFQCVYPTVRFLEARTGEQYTARGRNVSFPERFSVGQDVDIFYDPENPSNIKIKSFWQLWDIPFTLIVFSVCLALIFFLMT